MLESSAKSDSRALEFRTMLFIALVVSTATIYLADTRILAIAAAVTLAYLLSVTRRYKIVAIAYLAMLVMTALSIGVIYGTYALFDWLAAGTSAEKSVKMMKAAMLGNFHTPFLRSLPSMNVLLALMLNLSVQKFTGALKSLKMPRVVFLPLLVFCRFVPEFIDVVRQLRDAVRMRGFSVSFGSAFIHPIQTIRLTVIPLAVRSLRMADNLAMAAEMKRVGYAKRPTHLSVTHLQRRDWAVIAATTLLTAAVVVWQAQIPQKTMMSAARNPQGASEPAQH